MRGGTRVVGLVGLGGVLLVPLADVCRQAVGGNLDEALFAEEDAELPIGSTVLGGLRETEVVQLAGVAARTTSMWRCQMVYLLAVLRSVSRSLKQAK